MKWAPTYNMKVPKLCLGGDRIDLAHISPLILLLYVGDVEEPRAVLVVRDWDARVSGDHVTVNSQDGGLLKVHPRYL